MESPRVYRTDAIVLRRIDIGETDRVVILFTRNKGRLSSIAKGARRALSKLAASTEPFVYGRYMLAVGKNLDVITQVEIRESFPTIRKDISRIAFTLYLIELVDRFVEDRDANYDIFDTLLSSLYLMELGAPPEIIARSFELKLLPLLGYAPQLDFCLRCEAAPTGDELTYSPSFGGLICQKCGLLPEDTVYVQRKTVEGMKRLRKAEASELRRMDLPGEVLKEAANVLRLHIRYRLERDLKSLEFLQSIGALPSDSNGTGLQAGLK